MKLPLLKVTIEQVRQNFISLWDKTILAATGIGRVVRIWQYALLAILICMLFGVIMTLSSEGTTEWSLLISALPMSDKVAILWEAWIRFFSNIASVTGAITFAVSILQGLIIATLTYNIRNQEAVSSNRIGESTLASIAMVIGLGCPSCGTSLLVPLLGVVSSSLLSFLNVISVIILLIALTISLYTVWRVGYIAYAHSEAKKFKQKESVGAKG